jgi:hypothetical protein
LVYLPATHIQTYNVFFALFSICIYVFVIIVRASAKRLNFVAISAKY